MKCPFHQHLSPYLDGELDGLKAKKMKGHLKACAACQEELNLLFEIRTSLKQAAASAKAPASLKEKILGEAPQARTVSFIPRWNFAQAVPLVAMAVIGIIFISYYYRPRARDSFTDVVASMVNYHSAYESGGRSLSMRSSDAQNTESWFRRKIGFRISIPNAAFAEYSLEGADIFEQRGRKFAYLKYQRDGKTIGYIVFKDPGFSVDLPETVDIGGINLRIGEKRETNFGVWKKEGLIYVILTTEDRSELIEYAELCIKLF
jgi:anti-sigma factor (TIGR02949 family)